MPGNRQPARQALAIAALVAGASLDDAARAATVDARTLRRWRQSDPGFRAALAEAGAQVLDEATRRAASLQGKALDTIADVLDDADAPVWARLRAAEMALVWAANLANLHEKEERLATLEARLDEVERQQSQRPAGPARSAS